MKPPIRILIVDDHAMVRFAISQAIQRHSDLTLVGEAENGKNAPIHFHFGAPSCVPATAFETAGDEIDADGISRLLRDGTCHYLAEMMNWPGVIFGDEEVKKKRKQKMKECKNE